MFEQSFERARLIPENQTPERLFALKTARLLLAEAGIIDPLEDREIAEDQLEGTTGSPAINNWEAQIKRLVDLGFADELGMSKSQYRDTFPPFEDQPEDFGGKFPVSLAVDPRIAWQRQRQMMGLVTSELGHANKYVHQGYRDTPYQLWVQPGSLYLDMNVRAFDRMKLPFERGLNIYEGLALIREIPSLINSGVVLAGSRFDVDKNFPCVAKIGRVGRSFNLIHVYDSSHFRKSGIASCGELSTESE